MKITILGSGVVGVTTAYFLGARGHEVEVIDRGPDSACETSFANGGQLSFSHAEPWANPATLPKVFKWMFKKDAPLVLRPRADLDMIKWGMSFLVNCSASRAHVNSVNLLKLGLYSKKKLEQLSHVAPIQYHHIGEGILHIFSNDVDYTQAKKQAEYQAKFGCKEDILTTDEAITMEPALAHAGKKIVGGIHAPLDESGDAVVFTRELAKVCAQEFGAVFRYNTRIEKIEADNGRITSVVTDGGQITADAFVMAMGSYSPIYLRQIGIHVPIYPMKGYSVTLPANRYAPKVSVTDGELKIVYSRLGDRMRVAGTAEFAGYNTAVSDHRIDPMMRGIKELFPQAYTEENTTKWACLRPQTPDGPPIIGKTKYSNLYMNTGHGTLGWTQAAGSGALLADIIDNRPTEISLGGLTIERFN